MKITKGTRVSLSGFTGTVQAVYPEGMAYGRHVTESAAILWDSNGNTTVWATSSLTVIN